MAVYGIELLSGSVQGKGIKVTGTATAGAVTIHTAVTGTTDIDFVTLWAVNNDASASRTLVLEWGGATDPDNLIYVNIPPRVGPVMVCDRLPLQNALVIEAWCVEEANDLQIYGVVHRADK